MRVPCCPTDCARTGGLPERGVVEPEEDAERSFSTLSEDCVRRKASRLGRSVDVERAEAAEEIRPSGAPEVSSPERSREEAREPEVRDESREPTRKRADIPPEEESVEGVRRRSSPRDGRGRASLSSLRVLLMKGEEGVDGAADSSSGS
jgi:hypothetical protein